jgi:hypothetical protein
LRKIITCRSIIIYSHLNCLAKRRLQLCVFDEEVLRLG